jgi:protoheme IX farnesyltransferase
VLPVVYPRGLLAGTLAVVAALALVPVSLLPMMIGFAGPTYFIWALTLSLGYLCCSSAFLLRRNDQTARVLLWASLIFLPALLLSLSAGPFRY